MRRSLSLVAGHGGFVAGIQTEIEFPPRWARNGIVFVAFDAISPSSLGPIQCLIGSADERKRGVDLAKLCHPQADRQRSDGEVRLLDGFSQALGQNEGIVSA